jgi:hypothetical protein
MMHVCQVIYIFPPLLTDPVDILKYTEMLF